jgi:hypothetical protein
VLVDAVVAGFADRIAAAAADRFGPAAPAAIVLTQHRAIHGPPKYFTPDWGAAKRSVQRLEQLRPAVAITGHGMPMSGDELRSGLATLTRDFDKVAVPAEHAD